MNLRRALHTEPVRRKRIVAIASLVITSAILAGFGIADLVTAPRVDSANPKNPIDAPITAAGTVPARRVATTTSTTIAVKTRLHPAGARTTDAPRVAPVVVSAQTIEATATGKVHAFDAPATTTTELPTTTATTAPPETTIPRPTISTDTTPISTPTSEPITIIVP